MSAPRNARERPNIFVATDVTVLDNGPSARYSTHASLSDPALVKYHNLSDHITLIARTEITRPDAESIRLTSPGLALHALRLDARDARLPFRLVNLAIQLLRVPIKRGDIVVLRLPEMVSTLLWPWAKARRAHVITNVVADVDAVIQRFHLEPRISRRVLVALVAAMVRNSSATIYVTQKTLQRIYPPRPDAPSMSASNVLLDPDASFRPARIYEQVVPNSEPLRLVTVGAQTSPAKGQDLLIQALATLRAKGIAVELDLIGGGRWQPNLVSLAKHLSVTDAVSFHGHINNRRTLTDILDAADFFVMPSRTEGLPRAMIEAMARGLCCIGSRVGGIPELAPEEALFESGSAASLAERLFHVIEHPDVASSIARQESALALQIFNGSRPEVFSAFLQDVVTRGPARR